MGLRRRDSNTLRLVERFTWIKRTQVDLSPAAVLAACVILFIALCAAMGVRSLLSKTPPYPRVQSPGTAPVDVPTSILTTPVANDSERAAYVPSARQVIQQRAYPLLRFIAACLKVLGWIFIAVAAIALVVILVVVAVAYSEHNPFINAFSVPVLVSFAVATVVLGLLCVALSELVRVFVDIALNTGQLLQVALTIAANKNPQQANRSQYPHVNTDPTTKPSSAA